MPKLTQPMKFTKKVTEQIITHGLTEKQVQRDLERFEKGIPFTDLMSAATIHNGIHKLNSTQEWQCAELYEKKRDKLSIVKFVPASGAATRMFQHLHHFADTYNPEEQKLNEYLAENDTQLLEEFLNGLQHFAFTKNLRKKIRKLYPDYKFYKKGKRIHLLVKTLLEDEGLGYSNLPKGLIPFHKYKKNSATAFEEHLLESGYYAATQGQCYLHFTFTESYVEHFKKEFKNVKNRVERKTKCNFNISYSFQKQSTDTIAVMLNNRPFRDEQKNLHFRPAGHGALLENLNEVEADLIFIKNIDNVVTEEQVETIALYKKILTGKLLEVQQSVFKLLKALDKEPESESVLKDIRGFLAAELQMKNLPNNFDEARQLLDRPIRVCGMVKNTGAPGGGPFWVKGKDGSISLQIVELSQVNTEDAHQMNIVSEATHFNPVDLVCGVKNYEGEKFDLTQYVNPDSGFISQKSHQGKTIKALELPGLWNGSMAHWMTLFVEVPLQTFNPVKTVNDLLKDSHQVV